MTKQEKDPVAVEVREPEPKRRRLSPSDWLAIAIELLVAAVGYFLGGPFWGVLLLLLGIGALIVWYRSHGETSSVQPRWPVARRILRDPAVLQGLGVIAGVVIVLVYLWWPERYVPPSERTYLDLTPKELVGRIYTADSTTREAEQRIPNYVGKWMRLRNRVVNDVQDSMLPFGGLSVLTGLELGGLPIVTMKFSRGRATSVSHLRRGDTISADCAVERISGLGVDLSECEVVVGK